MAVGALKTLQILGRGAMRRPGAAAQIAGRHMGNLATSTGRSAKAGMLMEGRRQLQAGAPDIKDLVASSIPGGILSGLGTGLATGNPAAGLLSAGLDIGGSSLGASLASKALIGTKNPYAAALAPAARNVAIYGTTVAAPLAVEAMVDSRTDQRHMIQQQMSQRPYAGLAQYAPGAMYQTGGMAY